MVVLKDVRLAVKATIFGVTLTLGLAACESLQGNIALGVVGATIVGANAPTHEIQQIYYLGVFDPQEQLPPTVYRVRVHGQASFISQMKFASGWVRADLIDSLGTTIKFKKDGGGIEFTRADGMEEDAIKPGRRLMMFGPEGFREAPKDHRLVIVMGSSPEKFFAAIDEALGSVSGMLEQQRNSQLNRILFEALAQTKTERELLGQLERDVAVEMPEPRAGQ